MLSPTRDAEAAKRFFRCALEQTGECPTGDDKAAC
jgi:transposase-like protein